MPSKQKRRTPRNIYTEERAEREFHDFIQHSRLANLPIPENLLSRSELPQATDSDHPTASKRQRLTLSEVCQISYLFFDYF
jgi:hypothetical protein